MHKQVLVILLVCMVVGLIGASSIKIRSVSQQKAKLSPSPIQIVQSALYTNDRLTPLATPLQWKQRMGNLNAKVVLDSSTKYQKILGFGCALTESAAYTFRTMKPDVQKNIIDMFWTAKGLNYTMARIHMNACDFSLDNYSCDDVAGDYQLENFNIDRDRVFVLPLIKTVLQQVKSSYPNNGESFRIFLSPWSPPAWMKYNQHMDGSALPNGLINSSLIMDSWALHFSKFVTAYKKEGVDRMWGLTVQNEPEFAAPWDACCYTPEYQRDFIKNHLGPRIKRDHPELKLMIFDHNRDHVDVWAKVIYSDPEASKYTDGMAFHWYVDEQYQNLEKAHNVDPNKFLLATEACWDHGVSLGNWTRGEKYGYDIINDLENYASGWMDWNCILDWKGGPNHLQNWCDAPIIADNRTQEIHIQPTYYFFGHFTKYILQDSQRIRIIKDDTTKNLLITSFQTPENKIVTVVQNKAEQVVSFNLVDSVVGDNYYVQVDMPPRSIRTLIYSY